MTKLLKGAPVIEALNEKITIEVNGLKAKGVEPTLAIVRVGDQGADIAYERGAVKRCEKVGVKVKQVVLEADCTEETLIQSIKDLNVDDTVHGVLLFRPLPAHINDERVRNTLRVEKDIDGITDLSLAGVFVGQNIGYAPCTAQACMEILDFYNIDISGKTATVIGRSLVVGKPVAMMLLGKNATVTMCHTRTQNMPTKAKEADILIVCAGRAKVVDKEYFAKEQVVIDVGINVLEDGSMCGDANFEHAEGVVGGITPVPGGVGTVTTSVLVKHVVEAAKAVNSNADSK